MIFPLFSFFFSIIGLGYASYTDLRARVVSNRLNYALLTVGLALQAALSIVESNYWIFATAVAVVIVTFACSYLLWKLGVWAGGDVKLMTAIAALNPLNPNILSSVLGIKIPLFESTGLPIFPLTLFIFSLFATLPYGVLLSVRGLMKRNELRRQLKQEFGKKILQSAELAALVVGVSSALMLLNITLWAVLPILFAIGFLGKRIQIGIALATIAFALFQNAMQAAQWFAYLLALFMITYLFFRLFFVSREILRDTRKISELEEGEIPAESIYIREGNAVRGERIEMKTIINYFKNNRLAELQNYLTPKGTEVVSSRKARGLTVEEIEELKKLVREKKLEDRIEIKLSAPFVPAILIAYVLLNIVGDILWNVVL